MPIIIWYMLLVGSACGVLCGMWLLYRLFYFLASKRRIRLPLAVEIDDFAYQCGIPRKQAERVLKEVDRIAKEKSNKNNGPGVAASPSAAPAKSPKPETAAEKPAVSAEGQTGKSVQMSAQITASDWPPGWEREPGKRKAAVINK